MKTTKKFDKELFNENDAKAKAVVTAFAKSEFNIDLVESPFGEYGVDFLMLQEDAHGKYDQLGFCEVEVCLGWSGGNWPYQTLNIPIRKLKFVQEKCQFVLVSKDMGSIACVSGETLLNCKMIAKKNRFNSEPELFFDIKLEYVTFHEIKKEAL